MASFPQAPGLREQRNLALRLSFEYRGDQVRLVDQQRVEMRAPASDRVDEYESQSGFWVEVRDREDRVLYRRVMHNPIQFEHEAPSGDPEKPFTHAKIDDPDGAFTLVVPDFDQAEVVSLFGSPPARPAEPARQVLRVDLKEPGPNTPRG
jgi:hypothetical protein